MPGIMWWGLGISSERKTGITRSRSMKRSSSPTPCGRFGNVAALVTVIITMAAAGPVHGIVQTKEFSLSLKDTAEGVVSMVSKINGWDPALTKISQVDFKDTAFAEVMSYDFVLEVNKKRKEISLSEQIRQWDYLFEPHQQQPSLAPSASDGESQRPRPLQTEAKASSAGSSDEPVGGIHREVQRWEAHGRERPIVIPEFVLTGPLELWIHGSEQLRLAMPHDVDAGKVRKVVLAEGATVKVQGAQSIYLARPIQLPLPFNGSHRSEARGLLGLAEKLRLAAYAWKLTGKKQPMIALSIVKPEALVAVSLGASSGLTNLDTSNGLVATTPGRLKVKRLSETAVELVSRISRSDEGEKTDGAAALAEIIPLAKNPMSFGNGGETRDLLWPFGQVNSSDYRLLAIEKAIANALGKSALNTGSFKVLSASVTPARLVRINFEARLQLPSELKAQLRAAEETRAGINSLASQKWQVVARTTAGGKLQPLRLQLVNSVQPSLSLSWNLQSGNGTAGAGGREMFVPPTSGVWL